jgi:serine protease Do
MALAFVSLSARAQQLPFNEKKVPKSNQDLLAIQNALVGNLERVRKATVSISLGKGFGSGVIVSSDGLILTAAHVTSAVDKELTVILNDGTKLKAVSMGLVSNTDAAMMRITEEGEYPYVELNKDNDYKLSHWVMALGHSGGFDKARGPVVRLGRIVKDSETTLHTDCKVIGGDSGGPLFDLNGRLIGIHSRVSKSMEQNMHVPMREYLKHWKAMQENEFLGEGPFAKRPVKGSGFLGVGTTEVEKGLLIGKVGKESPAEKAGLEIGDVITKINDKKITKKTEFKTELKEMAEGQSIKLTIMRKGEEKVIELKLGKR